MSPITRLILHTANPYRKFDFLVSSLSRSGDISRGIKFYNGPRDPDHALPGKIVHLQGGTCYVCYVGLQCGPKTELQTHGHNSVNS